MKGSVVASGILHSLLLAWALISIGAPASFEVADVESMPVDIIPVESITQTMQGDEKAEMKDISAPVPTTKPTKVENAENAGDNEVDLKTPPTPVKRPQDVETAAAPEKVEKVQPKQDTVANEIKDIQKEEAATALNEQVALKTEPKEEVKPDPKPEVKPEVTPETTAEAEPAEEMLPDNVPVPVTKPKQEQKKAEEKPEVDTKKAEAEAKAKAAKDAADKAKAAAEAAQKAKEEKKKKETAKSKTSKESDFNADEVANLLNKTDATGGGAKRSTETAALGTKKSNGGSKLSQSEMDALRGQIENNWSLIAGIEGAEGVVIKVTMKLDETGDIIGDPEVVASGGSDNARRTLEGSALRAVMKSRPFKNLPRDKYDAWSEVVVNFDPSQLL